MPTRTTPAKLTKAARRRAFLALFEAQDAGAGVRESRRAVAERFGVSERLLGRVEEEGTDSGWPPLG